MQDLSELISQHVENHYHGRPFEGPPADLKRGLKNCGYGDSTEPSAETLAGLLINPTTRTAAIRHLIASVIFNHIELSSKPKNSLLPANITSFCQASLKSKQAGGEAS